MTHIIVFILFISLLFLIYLFTINKSHKHKWQVRGQNRYGGSTYRMCLRCRERQIRVNKSFEEEKWEICNPIPDLDDQFDENDKYIFE